MTTKRELRLALNALVPETRTECEAFRKLSAHIDSLPPDPFVLPPPGTEFSARLKSGDVRKFYVSKAGSVHELRDDGFSESWFRAVSAAIVEEST